MSLSVVKTSNLVETGAFVYQNDEVNVSAGFLSNGNISWCAQGPHIQFVDEKTNLKINEYTFGAVLQDSNCRIVCVTELITPFREVTLAVVGLESSLFNGMVCVLDFYARKVLRAVQIPEKVSSLYIVSNDSSIPGPLQSLDGILSVGTAEGNIYLIDLCRQIVHDIHSGLDKSSAKDEIDPCQLHILSISEIDQIEVKLSEIEQSEYHLALHLNSTQSTLPYFVLKGPKGNDRIHANKEEVCVSALCYAPQLSSLLVGYNFGALQLWNLLTMQLIYTSPVFEEKLPISHFAIQEPVDDPRAFCYFWAVYGNTEPYIKGFPVAALYALCYESKDWHEGYGYIYQNFQGCSIRFQMDLTNMDELSDAPLGGMCLNVQSISKGTNKVANQTSNADTNENSYALCLLVWNVWCKDFSSITYFGLFELNQWYRAEMPSSMSLCHETYIDVVNVSKINSTPQDILKMQILSNSITQFIGAQKLEEHYYPNSLAYSMKCISKQQVALYRNRGVQRQVFHQLESDGFLALMKPKNLFESAVKSGLTPLFIDIPTSDHSEKIHFQREFVLSVALENSMENWLCRCVNDWSNGSFRSVGLSLDMFLNWAWSRTNSLKTNSDRISVPLFDHSENKIDANVNNYLSNSRNQIFILKNIYKFIIRRCYQFLIEPEVTKGQLACLERIYSYLDVLGWLINVGLLPECCIDPQTTRFHDDKIVVPYLVDSLKRHYEDRRANLHILMRSKNYSDDGPTLFIDKLVELAGPQLHEKEWKCDDGNGQYPPPSLQALLRTYLVENMTIEHKHTIVSYLLLDLAMSLDQERYQVVIPTLIKFPEIFQLSTSSTKLIQALWQLDRGDLATATELLIDPIIKSDDITDWEHKIVLQALMLQDQEKLARLYLKVRQPPLKHYKDVCLALQLYIANEMLHEAFNLYRLYSGNEGGDLLNVIFKECNKTNQLRALLNMTLSRQEETALISFMNKVDFDKHDDFKSIYYMQRGRFFDFYQMDAPKRQNTTDVKRCLVDCLDNIMPKYKKELLTHCSKNKQNVFFADVSHQPRPLSVFLHNTSERVQYNSDYINATLVKSRETWMEINKYPQISDEDVPFLRAPRAFNTRKRQNLDLIYPEVIPTIVHPDTDQNDGDCPSPAKKARLSARTAVTSSPCAIEVSSHINFTKIETPIVRRRSPIRNSTDRLGTPHSILKMRSARKSLTPPPADRGNSTTPENLDDIDSASVDHEMTDLTEHQPAPTTSFVSVSPRKSLRSSVRFSGIPSSSTSPSTLTTTTEKITSKLTEEIPNEDLSADTFYSPNTSFAESQAQEEENVEVKVDEPQEEIKPKKRLKARKPIYNFEVKSDPKPTQSPIPYIDEIRSAIKKSVISQRPPIETAKSNVNDIISDIQSMLQKSKKQIEERTYKKVETVCKESEGVMEETVSEVEISDVVEKDDDVSVTHHKEVSKIEKTVVQEISEESEDTNDNEQIEDKQDDAKSDADDVCIVQEESSSSESTSKSSVYNVKDPQINVFQMSSELSQHAHEGIPQDEVDVECSPVINFTNYEEEDEYATSAQQLPLPAVSETLPSKIIYGDSESSSSSSSAKSSFVPEPEANNETISISDDTATSGSVNTGSSSKTSYSTSENSQDKNVICVDSNSSDDVKREETVVNPMFKHDSDEEDVQQLSLMVDDVEGEKKDDVKDDEDKNVESTSGQRTRTSSTSSASNTFSRSLRSRTIIVEDAPSPKRVTRRNSVGTPEPQPLAPSRRVRSASVDVEHKPIATRSSSRTTRAKSVEVQSSAIKTRRQSVNTTLPAIAEEDKTVVTRSTRRRKKDDTLELQTMDPIQLLDKEEFKGTADPEEEQISDSQNSSPSAESTTSRTKRSGSVVSESAVSPPKRGKRAAKKAQESSPPLERSTRRGRSASIETTAPAGRRTTRKASQESQASVDSELSTSVRVTRHRSSSKDIDSDVDTTITRSSRSKKHLENIAEETNSSEDSRSTRRKQSKKV